MLSGPSTKKAVGFPYTQFCHCCTMGSSWLAGGFCRTQGVALGKTLDLSSPPVTSIAPPSRMRTSQQKRHSQLRQSSLCPAPEACDIFCTGILSSSHGRQPRAMAIARIVLGTSGASLTTLCLALKSSFNNHVLGTALFTHAGKLCSNSCSKML